MRSHHSATRGDIYQLHKHDPVLPTATKIADEWLKDFQQQVQQAFVRKGNLEVFSPSFFSCENALHIIIPSQTLAINATVLTFQRWITQCCREGKMLTMTIGVCLQEALVNAIIHGNLGIPSSLEEQSWRQFETLVQEREALPEFANRQAIVRCQIQPGSIQLEVEDEGHGFNPNQVTSIMEKHLFEMSATNPGSLTENGRGILIITRYMDDVSWNPRGNCITMIKKISSA